MTSIYTCPRCGDILVATKGVVSVHVRCFGCGLRRRVGWRWEVTTQNDAICRFHEPG